MMRPMMLALFLVAAAALANSGFAAAADRLTFDHALHAGQDLTCLDCHAAATTSADPQDVLIPGMDVCASCHDTDSEENCTMCHSNPDAAGAGTSAAFGADVFPHTIHAADNGACATCHAAPAGGEPRLPVKADCRTCHATAEAFADCGQCHRDPRRPVPASHVGDWVSAHDLPAQSDPGRCYQCHTETGCQECHAGDNLRPRSHGLNFAFSHSIVARGNEMECAACHEDPQYCSSCHIAERVLPASHSTANWVNGTDGGQHAFDAPFEMEQCIACHDNGSASPSCAACHGG